MSLNVCFLALSAYPTLAGTTEARVGGAEVQQVMLGGYLAEQGYQVSFVTRDHGQEDREVINGITVYKTFRQTAGLPVLRFIYPRWISIWRALRKADADIYYQRCASMETGLAAMFCQRYGKKLVFAAGSDSDFDPARHIIPTWRDRILYKYGLQHAHSIIAQTSVQRHLLEENFEMNAVVIPNCWTDEESSGRVTEKNQKYVLWVSTLRDWKRPGLFLDMAERLSHQHFVMVGGAASGEDRLYRDIQARAAQLDNVTFAGFVPFKDVGRYFDGASVFVNTSEPKEGFPNALIQAWQRGIPVVTYFDPDSIVSRENIGYVVANQDEAVNALAEFFANDTLHEQKGAAAKRYFDGRHRVGALGPEYKKLFHDLVQA